MVDRYRHIYQFKEREVKISKKQYPKGAIEIEKPLFNRNMAAHLLLRVVGPDIYTGMNTKNGYLIK